MNYLIFLQDTSVEDFVESHGLVPAAKLANLNAVILSHPHQDILDELNDDPCVKLIEAEDAEIEVSTSVIDTGPGEALLQLNDPVGHARYEYTRDGSDVWIYVGDTGRVWDDSEEFNHLRRELIYSHTTVGNNHATQVASVAVGRRCGVAKNSFLGFVTFSTTTNHALAIEAILDHFATHNFPAVYVTAIAWTTAPEAIVTALQTLLDAGIAVVASAGNGSGVSTSYPAAWEPAIVVGGYDEMFNYYGNSGSGVDILARTTDVRCAFVPFWHNPLTSLQWQPLYGAATGTSLAAPQVAGICALILQWEPTLTPTQLKTRLLEWATPHTIQNLPADTTNMVAQVPTDVPGRVFSEIRSAPSVVTGFRGEVHLLTPDGVISGGNWVDQDGNPVDPNDFTDKYIWDPSTYIKAQGIDT